MTLIVKQGILKTGSILIIEDQYTKIKNMHDDAGKTLTEAKPGDAVQIIGIPSIPSAGDFVYELEDENKAKYIVTKRKQMSSQSLQKIQAKSTLKTSKIRLDYRTRKAMYGSATGNAWISKFNEKETAILEKLQNLRSLEDNNPNTMRMIQQTEIELKDHKEYVYQFLVNIGENKSNYNVILKFADRGIEETVHQQIEPII